MGQVGNFDTRYLANHSDSEAHLLHGKRASTNQVGRRLVGRSWVLPPPSLLAAEKYHGRPRAQRRFGLLTQFPLARSLRGGKAIDMRLDALLSAEWGACFFFSFLYVYNNKDGICMCVCICRLLKISPAIVLQSSYLQLFFASHFFSIVVTIKQPHADS